MADALAFAAEKKPDLICDVATLTGAAYVALGVDIGAVISNSEKYAAEFIKSNKKISFRVLAQIASAVPKRVKFTKLDYNGTNQILIEGMAASDQDILKLISNLNNKKLISQASLASMTLPNTSGSTNNTMKGFLIACKLENV